jgi:hypothetical protein
MLQFELRGRLRPKGLLCILTAARMTINSLRAKMKQRKFYNTDSSKTVSKKYFKG